MDSERAGRPNQRRRTRKDLLLAAARLIRQGTTPTLEEIAEEALVSRATAYRYFPGLDALLVEAALDVAVPETDEILRNAPPDDAVARVTCVDDALNAMIKENEAQLRTMLAHSLRRPEHDGELLARQNRRTPLVEAALDPVRDQFAPEALDMLIRALPLVIGTEAMIVFKDVLQLGEEETLAVKRWAIRALIEAAQRPDTPG
ncbi:TetR/AcrR family transcriptional regulator [Sphingomonas cavernae]|uniref:TetR/AcrR family transcriptional regulator n=1 Tax=Sphingomonas cavernae TaxID=2320861 RepID=A0A418WQR6_9SPHN|nr:TetR/AcrR family transcriptional regulator [Sphingomonas cavernae]RJF93595.1 TetR/AcrR family transcriptional regulator [Sphingomonas cavernae]